MQKLILDKQLIIRRIFLISLDICCIVAASIMGLLIRFDFIFWKVETIYLDHLWAYLPINVICTLLIFYIFRLYHSLWIFAGLNELENIVSSCVISAILQLVGLLFLNLRMPRSYYIAYGMFLLALITFTRFAYRALRLFLRKRVVSSSGKNVMIIGAGQAASVILKEIMASEHLDKTVKCIIDDAPEKQGMFIHGIKVVGNRYAIPEAAVKYGISEINIAMPSISSKEIKEIIEICRKTDCELKILPGIYQVMNGDVSVSKLRSVDVEDLLGRDSIEVDLESIMDYVTGKVVMVTGGGGSIGSELCRQLASYQPKQLIILDIYENNAYDIQQELHQKYPELNMVVLIASVRNTKRVDDIFRTYHPDIVYHAAAHKHVPLMEDSPNEAVKNNVFGTFKVASAADKYGVSKFVLISTDKAVNPTNIMGATKRICEMIIQTFNNRSTTEFVAVRFGNVLGSNGSVIPLFKKQIRAGGPVTVTHPDIIRYFMTIPEAISLVLQAGAYAKGGEIFILDMGEPVKILDLAINLIRLSGYVPDEDIMIEFTGLRPGEKLYEELLMKEEGMLETENRLIHIGKPIEMDEERFLEQLKELKEASNLEAADIKQRVQEIVKTYAIKEDEVALQIAIAKEEQ